MTETGFEPVSALTELTGMSARTIANNIRSGNLPGLKIGGRWFVPRGYLQSLAEKSIADRS